MNIVKENGKLNYRLLEKAINALSLENGVLILEPMSKKNRKSLNGFLWERPNLHSFVLSNEFERKIALRYVCKNTLNYKKTHELAFLAYERGDFETAKVLFLRLVSHGLPDSQAYAKVAMCYLQLADYSNALNYLQIADHLSKAEIGQNLYASYIDTLVTMINSNLDKNIKALALEIDVTNQFGITNLKDIVALVSGTDTDIESACLIFGLDKFQTQIVKLIIAQQCYRNKMIEYGDVLTTQVEKEGSKNKTILALLEKTLNYRNSAPKKCYARIRVSLNNKNVVE